VPHFPVAEVRGNKNQPFGTFQSFEKIFFPPDSDVAKDVFSGKTEHLTNFKKSNPHVLKNTPGEFPDMVLIPFGMGKFQIPFHDTPMTPVQNIRQASQQPADPDNILSGQIGDKSGDVSGKRFDFFHRLLILFFCFSDHKKLKGGIYEIANSFKETITRVLHP